MKIFKFLFISVFLVVGCSNSSEDLGDADLNCELVNIRDEENNNKNASYYEVFVDNDSVSKVRFSVEIIQKNVDKKELNQVFDAIESLYTNQKSYEGVTYNSTRDDESLNINIIFDVDSLEKYENSVNIMGYFMDLDYSLDDYKITFESDNYVCK